ncbi:Ribosome biogenesis regulatory like protein [Dictyocoela muelleri]|nr:Ribosome biogenesis regulatory like protein [Dictyocoela muelleri]
MSLDLHYLLLISKDLSDNAILDHIKYLQSEVKKLKVIRQNNENVYSLPKPIFKIPVLHKNKPKTKWQKFAESKKIRKNKSGMKFDGDEMVPKYGPGSKSNDFEVIDESKYLKMMKKKFKTNDKHKNNINKKKKRSN